MLMNLVKAMQFYYILHGGQSAHLYAEVHRSRTAMTPSLSTTSTDLGGLALFLLCLRGHK